MEAIKVLYAPDDEKGNRRELRIYIDPDPQDPHEDDNEYIKLALFHNRYSLPNDSGLDSKDYDGWGDLADAIPAKWKATVWMYDHSGLAFRVGADFAEDQAHWDSGVVGFIYMEPQVAAENGIDTYERFIEVAKAHIEVYNAYQSGQVYGYEEVLLHPTFFADGMTTAEFFEEDVHSCWGFYDIEDILGEHPDYKEAQGFVLVHQRSRAVKVTPGNAILTSLELVVAEVLLVENYGAGERYTIDLEKAHRWTSAKYAEAQKASEERVMSYEDARRLKE